MPPGESHVLLLKVRPPNGWPTVWWELGIVTLGVIIALAAQQWADGRAWAGKARTTREALREELALHYSWSVEWRATLPCMLAQIDRLQRRVLASGATLEPAPVFRNANFAFTVRLPSKEYSRSVYDAALADGVLQRFDPALRRVLNTHYTQVDALTAMTRQNDDDIRPCSAQPGDPARSGRPPPAADDARPAARAGRVHGPAVGPDDRQYRQCRHGPASRRGAARRRALRHLALLQRPAPAAALVPRGDDRGAELICAASRLAP